MVDYVFQRRLPYSRQRQSLGWSPRPMICAKLSTSIDNNTSVARNVDSRPWMTKGFENSKGSKRFNTLETEQWKYPWWFILCQTRQKLDTRYCEWLAALPMNYQSLQCQRTLLLQGSTWWYPVSVLLKHLIGRFTFLCLGYYSLPTNIGGEKVPRPLRPSFYGENIQKRIRFDFIYTGRSLDGEIHVLFLNADHFGQCCLISIIVTSALNATHETMHWCALFKTPIQLIADWLAYIKNEAILKVTKKLRVHHYFTWPYFPWSNG